MAQTIETTLVTEAYNLAEGMGYAELEAAVATVAGIASAQPTVEALLVDGSDDPRDVRIPWIAWGRGVKPGHLDGTPVRTFDTASTVLWLLGVEEPSDWAGAPVLSAFQSPVAVD